MHKIIISIALIATCLGPGSFTHAKESKEFEIEHADTLEINENEIKIAGNVLIKFQDTIIEAPEAKIITNQNGNINKAVFLNRAKLSSQNKVIESDEIIVLFNTETIYAIGNSVSTINDKDNNPITIHADYQTLNWQGEGAYASGHINTLYVDTKITSDEAKIIYDQRKPSYAIFSGFQEQANLEQPNHKTKANRFIFDLNSKDINADGNVISTIWPYKSQSRTEQNPIFVNADKLLIEEETGEIKAEGTLNKVKLTYEDTKGESKKALLVKNQESKVPEKIIFNGNANVSQTDKELSSEEVIFNFNNKKLTSNTISDVRPKTLIFKQE